MFLKKYAQELLHAAIESRISSSNNRTLEDLTNIHETIHLLSLSLRLRGWPSNQTSYTIVV